jgi:putative nucleotidyltransferase with HDIG domain
MIRAEDIVARLCACGYEAYTVGGAVRDILLGLFSEDEDIVTNARPEEIRALFGGHQVRVVGESFPVALVDGCEVATYRTDYYEGLSARNGRSVFARTLQEDLLRRDFTYNAMAFCQYTGDIVDPCGGRVDLANRVTRFVGNPDHRIYEDPCRILRACRFRAKTRGEFETGTLRALKEHAPYVRKYVAPERIRIEILKAMKLDRPSLFFQALHEIDVLKDVLPGLESLYGLASGPHHREKDVFEHAMLVGDALSAQRQLLRLTGYLHDVGKAETAHTNDAGRLSFIGHEKAGAAIVTNDLRQLKFGNEEIGYVSKLTRHHMRRLSPNSSPKAMRRALVAFRADGVAFKDWMRLRIADRHGNKKARNYGSKDIRTLLNLHQAQVKESFGLKDLAVNGWDVMRVLDIRPGPRVGKELKNLLGLVLDNPEHNNRKMLTAFLETRKSTGR